VKSSTPSLLRKLLLGSFLALTMLVLGLAVLEFALRLGGYGASPHFARAARLPDGTRVWRDNRDCTVPYFGRELARRPLPFSLPQEKAKGSYRIFVLGSSAAMGDPEPSFSLARCLGAMLGAAYPEVHFEVVNAGVTAINSHVMRGIAADCSALSPDLLILYEGNNEVIGPFGPSGVFAPFLHSGAAIRAAAWLKGLRVGQLIASGSARLHGKGALPLEWGGMGMFLRQQLPVDDPRLELVRAHFGENLVASCRSASAVGARTLLCTVPVNERDFAPFLSLHRSDLSSAELARFEASRRQAADALARKDLAGARTALAQALSIDPLHAETTFQLGRLCLQSGRDGEAEELLSRARDLDALRFRTDSVLNGVIRDCAASGIPGLRLVDLAAGLSSRSAHGLCGDELFYEHVHLTLRGAYEASRMLFAAIQDDLIARGTVKARPAPLSYDELRTCLAFTLHEQGMIYASLLQRFRAPPFTGQADNAYRIQLTEKRLASAGEMLRPEEATGALLTLYQSALKLAPKDWMLLRNTGSMLLARHQPKEALAYLQQAQALLDDDIDTLVALARAHDELGHKSEAAALYHKARLLEPRYPGLPAD